LSLILCLIDISTGEIPSSYIKSASTIRAAVINVTVSSFLVNVSDPLVADFIANSFLPIDQRPDIFSLM
jgi:hypothetical protein